MSFRYSYITFSCIFKHLGKTIYDAEKSAREVAKDYENPIVELVTFQKVGFSKYLTVWKIQGYLKE
ncbi:hypothetical protein [Lysinibacillus sp. CTST325]